jgi:uncharacterized protein YdaU (DUF1376 family)
MNYYKHHIGDFIRDTSRLTDSQCMAYLRLIWIYYESEMPLPDDTADLSFKIGAKESDVIQILKNFFFLNENHWHQARCDEEILAFREKSEKAKNSIEKRWKNAKKIRNEYERIENQYERITEVRVLDTNHKPLTIINNNTSDNPDPDNPDVVNSEPLDTPIQPIEKVIVPYGEIIALYNECCTDLVGVNKLTDDRKRKIKKAWLDDDRHQSLDFWRRFFEFANRSRFLSGKQTPWRANFDFIIKTQNITKIIEGTYHGNV